MNLSDAISYHQLVLASEGRTVATQRQYLYFERQLLRYLESQDIRPELAELNPANVRGALAWYQAQDSRQRTRGGEVGAQSIIAEHAGHASLAEQWLNGHIAS